MAVPHSQSKAILNPQKVQQNLVHGPTIPLVACDKKGKAGNENKNNSLMPTPTEVFPVVGPCSICGNSEGRPLPQERKQVFKFIYKEWDSFTVGCDSYSGSLWKLKTILGKAEDIVLSVRAAVDLNVKLSDEKKRTPVAADDELDDNTDGSVSPKPAVKSKKHINRDGKLKANVLRTSKQGGSKTLKKSVLANKNLKKVNQGGSKNLPPNKKFRNLKKGLTSKKIHKCNDCNYESKYAHNVKRHKETHNPIMRIYKMYKCNDCNYESKFVANLTRHKETHAANREPKHVCRLCPRAFIHKESLSKHVMVVHTKKGRKIYKCNVCNFKANFMSNLKKHMETHNPNREPKHVCSVCSRAFLRKPGLKNHVQDVHTQALLVCKHCTFSTKKSQSFRRHNEKEHNGLSWRNFSASSV